MYRETCLRLAICCIAVLAIPVAARAELITFGFTGVVASVPTELASEFAVGEPILGSYTFESTTPDSNLVYIDYGEYDEAITSFTATIGSDYTVTQGLENDIIVAHSLYQINLFAPTAPSVGGLLPIEFNIGLLSFDGDVFNSDNLPLTPPDLSEFEFNISHLSFSYSPPYPTVGFVVTSLTLVIPEPTTCGLVMIATLCLVVGRPKSLRAIHRSTP